MCKMYFELVQTSWHFSSKMKFCRSPPSGVQVAFQEDDWDWMKTWAKTSTFLILRYRPSKKQSWSLVGPLHVLNCAQKYAHIPPQKNSRQYRHGCSSWRHPAVFSCQTLTQLVDSCFGHAVTYHTCGWDGLLFSPLQKIIKGQKLNVTAQEWWYRLSWGQVGKKTSTNRMELHFSIPEELWCKKIWQSGHTNTFLLSYVILE